MKEIDFLAELTREKVIIPGHSTQPPGTHVLNHFDEEVLCWKEPLVANCARALAGKFARHSIDAVVAPATDGAAMLSIWMARYFREGTGRRVCSYGLGQEELAKTRPWRHNLRRPLEDKRVLVANVQVDLKTLRQLVQRAREYGGTVLGVVAIRNCGSVKPHHIGGVTSIRSLVELPTDTWSPKDCARSGLCAQGAPLLA